MIAVAWTMAALGDIEVILNYVAARSPQGAANMAARVRDTELTISTFPRAFRRDPATGVHEAVVRGMPLLLIYQIVGTPDGSEQADIIAVFYTSRDPAAKPGRRDG